MAELEKTRLAPRRFSEWLASSQEHARLVLGGDAAGFTAALAVGGLVQLMGAATAWATVSEAALR